MQEHQRVNIIISEEVFRLFQFLNLKYFVFICIIVFSFYNLKVLDSILVAYWMIPTMW